MIRRTSPTTSGRATRLDCTPEQAWAVAASGRPGPRWYVDAGPLLVRGAIDRLLPGAVPQSPLPDRDLLEVGDGAGFWRVTGADPVARRLELTARVRAPGTVVLTTVVEPDGPQRCRLRQEVSLRPSGLLGVAYLVTDLPAREVVIELTHRRLVADVRRATGGA
ncbi:MAG: DUF2867 domain-containing protein [Nocardioides sp.]|nr:DUF2867 domain-containing protein [Nocardioides sp.]